MRGISLSGGFSRFRTTRDQQEWKSLSLRIPIRRGINVTLWRTITSSNFGRTGMSFLGLTLPFGRLRFHGQFQVSDNKYLPFGTRLVLVQNRQREFLSGVSYRAGRKLNIQYQTANRWRRDGAMEQWQQFVGTYHMTKKTQFEAISILPTTSTPSQMRVRLTQQVSKTLALVVEYGNVSPYQGIEIDPEEKRFKVMLQKQWSINTPARGANIAGIVTDPLGYLMEGALVRLGNYASMTGEDGRYAFHFVPEGTYQIRLDEKSLPAEYASHSRSREIQAHLRSQETVDFEVTPLNTIQGRVCVDENRNSRCESGEGIERVPIHLGDHVTASGPAGVFGFYNLPPGRHVVRIGMALIAKKFTLISPRTVEVSLQAGIAPRPVEFLLEPREREIIYQTVD